MATLDHLILLVNDSDASHQFGALPGIDIEKSTNGLDADTRVMVYQTLMHEAKTYNRYRLSLNLQRHLKSK